MKQETKKFKLNDCGVCINANEHVVFDEGYMSRFVIKTAKLKGKWVGSYDIMHGNSGMCSPVTCERYDTKYKTEDEVIQDIANTFIERHKKTAVKLTRAVNKEIKKCGSQKKNKTEQINYDSYVNGLKKDVKREQYIVDKVEGFILGREGVSRRLALYKNK